MDLVFFFMLFLIRNRRHDFFFISEFIFLCVSNVEHYFFSDFIKIKKKCRQLFSPRQFLYTNYHLFVVSAILNIINCFWINHLRPFFLTKFIFTLLYISFKFSSLLIIFLFKFLIFLSSDPSWAFSTFFSLASYSLYLLKLALSNL